MDSMIWPKAMDHLAELSVSIAHKPAWSRLAAYLDLRSKGLRPQALKALEEFIDEASRWRLDERLSLVRWLEANDDRSSGVMPFPLIRNLLAPTISEWLEAEPQDADASCFYAIYVAGSDSKLVPADFLNKALKIDPNHQKALNTKLKWLIDYVYYAQHELPALYLGSPESDLEALREAIPLAERLLDNELRENRLATLTKQLATVQNWMDFEESTPRQHWSLREDLWFERYAD